MKPYEEFKQDMKKLVEHAVKHELCLDAYVDNKDIHTAKDIVSKQNSCGCPCCLAGYLPEVFPDQFEYRHVQVVGVIPASKECPHIMGSDCIYALTKVYRLELGPIFFSNNCTLGDHQVVMSRLKVILECDNYYELSREITNDRTGIFA